MRIIFLIGILLASLGLAACSTDEAPLAPVVDVESIEHVPTSGVYYVLPGETLYSIAWRYGLDYRYLVERNHIDPPYHVKAGQLIYLKGTPVIKKQPAIVKIPTKIVPIKKRERALLSVAAWSWPAHGPLIGIFSSSNKGINIGGEYGSPVYASAAGVVVYSGDGLRSYGNLIIIKHNAAYLTAYAHNSIVLVKEGSWVEGGQKIAEMGYAAQHRAMLHFEIRKDGRPVNPLRYLARRS